MPLYEYECERGHRFERIVKYSDPPIAVCPECGAAVHKLMSSPAIQFKGSGFYITDYARKGSGEGKDSTDTKSTKSSEAGESKESKDSKDSKDSKEPKTEKAATSETATTTPKAETSSSTSTKSD
jgi:putative FmdB family regulatory protein